MISIKLNSLALVLLVAAGSCHAQDKPTGFHSHPPIPVPNPECTPRKPAPAPTEKTCEEIGQEHQAAQAKLSGILKSKYVCSATCVCYADREDIDEFYNKRCCTFIPCPGSSKAELAQYQAYRKVHCPPPNTKPPGTGGIKPPPSPVPDHPATCEEIGREQQALRAQSNAQRSPIPLPRYQCSDTCVCYSQRGDLEGFKNSNCCRLIPCPGSSQETLGQYESYRQANCPASQSTATSTSVARSEPGEKTCEQLGREQQEANAKKSIFRADYVCSSTCVCYANRGDSANFSKNGCCDFIPCPGSSQEALNQYASYKQANCPSSKPANKMQGSISSDSGAQVASSNSEARSSSNDASDSSEKTCEQLGQEQQEANAKKSIFRANYACSSTCVCYANRGDSANFSKNNCCTFIPCPGSSQGDLDNYESYKADQCKNSTTAASTENQSTTEMEPTEEDDGEEEEEEEEE